MIVKKGKYNQAKVMIDEIDYTIHEQIDEFLNQEAFADSNIVIMPDCHAGSGAVIGLTMTTNNYIIPNVIGVDIGCGVLSYCFGEIEIDVKNLDKKIRENVPAGFNVNKNSAKINTKLMKDILNVCPKLNIDSNQVFNSIGSLGGGNHFIEAGYDCSQRLWITVHSGSRNFGFKIANFYQNLAKEHIQNRDIVGVKRGLEFLLFDSKEGKNYLHDLKVAQEMASHNRHEILTRIEEILCAQSTYEIESIHNYIGEDGVIRKGAISANEKEMVLIPLNMRDGIIIGEGKGNKDYNCSAPHGAGRILSRKQAKSSLDINKLKKDMEDNNIYTTSVNESTLDEAPDAYKKSATIFKHIKDTVELVDVIKPIYNFKA